MKIFSDLQTDRKRIKGEKIKGESFCGKHFLMGKRLVLQEG